MEKTNKNKKVITLDDVNKMIAVMGKVEEFEDEKEEKSGSGEGEKDFSSKKL